MFDIIKNSSRDSKIIITYIASFGEVIIIIVIKWRSINLF